MDRHPLGQRLQGDARLPVDEVAVPFWKEIQRSRAEHDVKVAIEMHPHNLVFNPATMKRLVEATGATNVGAEMDPSHLFWQQMDRSSRDPSARALVFFAAAKDTLIHDGGKINGVLDDRFPEWPAGRTRQVPPAAATPSTSGPRTRPGPSSPSVVATTSTSGRASSGHLRGGPGHARQHRARGRLDVGARRARNGCKTLHEAVESCDPDRSGRRGAGAARPGD